MKMVETETADAFVALGGDRGNTVPKKDITIAEIVALQAHHGDDAVFDIVPKDSINIDPRMERARLRFMYRGMNAEGLSLVDEVFPGRGSPQLPLSFDDINLPEELFAAETRKVPIPKRKPVRRKAAQEQSDDAGPSPLE